MITTPSILLPQVSGKAQTSDGGPGGQIALPRGYGGAAHNFNPSNPGGSDDSVRGEKRPCFKRAQDPDYLMDSTQARLNAHFPTFYRRFTTC